MQGMSEHRQTVAYIVSQELVKISSLLPSNLNRSFLVHSLISSLKLLKPNHLHKRCVQVVNPSRASKQVLSVYHSKDYLDVILGAHDDSNDFGLEDDCPVFPGLSDYVQVIGGATLTAVETLKTGFAEVAICWDGGRHHARKSRASGFCYVADCTLALLSLKKPVPTITKPRVMYIDLDLHFSDGVSEAFHKSHNSQILTFSIHHAAPGFFPACPLSSLTPSNTSDPFTLSIPLALGASSKTYARIYPLLERTRDIFKPDYVVLQCGVDGLAGDPYATFNWSLGSGPEGSMGWYVDKIVNEWPGRKLLLGGGGYNSSNAARAWAYLSSIALGTPLDLEAEIPDHSGFPHYAPSFTLDVEEGCMQDMNTEEDLHAIETTFDAILGILKARLDSAAAVSSATIGHAELSAPIAASNTQV